MNIIYLHGLSSSGQSNTARLLRELLLDDNVVSPDIPVEPIEALQMLLELAGKYPVKDSVVIGTSMGAMYAFQMKGYRRILVNPAFHVSDFLQDKIGTNLPFFNQREDEESNFYVSEELCDCYRSMETSLWSNNFEGSKNLLALFGDEDDVCDNREEYSNAGYLFSEFHGGHRLNEQLIQEVLLPVIEWAKAHQEFIPETIELPFSEVRGGDTAFFYEGGAYNRDAYDSWFKVYAKGIGRDWFDKIKADRNGETIPDGRVASFIFPELPQGVVEDSIELVYGNRAGKCPTVEIYGHGHLAIIHQEIKIGSQIFRIA